MFVNSSNGGGWRSPANCTMQEPKPANHGAIYVFNHRYFFPVIASFGVVGNLANLVVLSSRGMRSRTSLFLSSMAVTDILFFLATLPITLDVYDELYHSQWFLQFYFYAQIPFLAWANWFSAASIWLSVSVTFERLVAVRYPLHVRLILSKQRIFVIIASILVATFPLTCHYYFSRTVRSLPLCDNPSFLVYRWFGYPKSQFPVRRLYVTVSTYAFVFFGIALPMTLLIVLNCALIYYLKINSKFRLALIYAYNMATSHDSGDSGSSGHSEINRRSSLSRSQVEERKITLLVVLIIASFVMLNLPSAILVLWHALLGQPRMPTWYHELSQLSNMLVCFGKALNFIIYCFASSHFRSLVFNCYLAPKHHLYDIPGHYEKVPKSIEELMALRRNTV